MFDFAMEIIMQSASNSLFIFCLCNLIIAIIFVISNERRASLPKSVTKADATDNLVQEIKAAAESVGATTESGDHSNIVIVDQGFNSHGDDQEDDEFNARIEDFIAKVNREWEAEKLKAKSLS